MDILDDMGVSTLSAKVFFKVNYSCKWNIFILFLYLSMAEQTRFLIT